MTKQELINKVAADADISRGQAKSAVDAAFEAIAAELAANREVAIAGFGKFSVSERSARQGVNPATGERIQIAPSTAARFRPRPHSRSSSTADRDAAQAQSTCGGPAC